MHRRRRRHLLTLIRVRHGDDDLEVSFGVSQISPLTSIISLLCGRPLVLVVPKTRVAFLSAPLVCNNSGSLITKCFNLASLIGQNHRVFFGFVLGAPEVEADDLNMLA